MNKTFLILLLCSLLLSGYTESLAYNTAEGCTKPPRVLIMKCKDGEEKNEIEDEVECDANFPYRYL